MTDEIDPDLKRLFAVTAGQPSDEAFVAAVAERTARLRLLTLAGAGLGLILFAVLLAAAATRFGAAIDQAALTFGQLAASLSASPFGWIEALSLVLAAALCWRALVQIARGLGGG
jgi:hypothetical protein